VIDGSRAERQPAFRERGDHKPPQALLHVIAVRYRAPAVSRDIEHESHTQRPASLPPAVPGRYRDMLNIGLGRISSPSVSHFFPTLLGIA
jgi:hypothetical protein